MKLAPSGLPKRYFSHKGEFIFQTSKTRESRRLISLDTMTLSLLNKWRIRQNEAYLAGKSYLNDNKMVFDRDDGSPMRLAYPNDKLAALIKKHNFTELLFMDYVIHMLPFYLKQEQVSKKFRSG